MVSMQQASMDDEETYGPEFHRLSFGRAVEQGLLTDYKVLVLAVNEDAVSSAFQRQLASAGGGELQLDDVARIVGCWKALAKLGYTLDLEHTGPQDLQNILRQAAGKPEAQLVSTLLLRSLKQAKYSAEDLGHFGLAFKSYLHFTSPIRRYPDLVVHRVVRGMLQHRLSPTLKERMRTDFPQLAEHASDRERVAESAERELRNFLVMQLLAEHIGEEFPGVVTGVTNTGVFVRLSKYLTEGLVKSSDLPTPQGAGGFWKIDQRTGALVEQRSGRSYKLGDRVSVVVSAVDLARRQMELLISDEESRKRLGVGKGLKLGASGGGLAPAHGAGFDKVRTGAEKRAARSKSRDRRKDDHRSEQQKKRRR